MDAYEPNHNFDYDNIFLENPRPVQGGSYFTKISMNPNKQLYVQFPKCLTKQGVVSTKKGKYCDLMYERGNETELVEWIERLETKCHDLIDAKKSVWFHNDLAREDIESMMSPICRLYKSGKNILIRVNIDTIKQSGKDKCVVYDENEGLLDLDLDVITEERVIIPLVLIEGIKFTSKSFEVEIKLLQMMVLDPVVEPLKSLMIKKPAPSASSIIAPSASLAPNTTSIVKEQVSKIKEEEKTLDNGLEEINIDIDNLDNSITLKKPNELYYEMYKVARQKAKRLRQVAVQAHLEAKQIKTKYMLSDDDEDDEDDDDDDEYDENVDDDGNN